jgi:hypothetical protein
VTDVVFCYRKTLLITDYDLLPGLYF